MSVIDRPRLSMGKPALITVAAVSFIVLIILNPWLIVSPTTPNGGDMGAHVLGPAFLRDTLLPEGRLLGWSDDWFAGFPAFYFYFPLPSLVIVALDVFLPYGVAFKLVTILGLVSLPFATYFHARCIRLSRSVSVVAATAGVVFVFMESFTIYGGNMASTLAGEFSYSWSFSLSLVYLGLLVKAVREDRRYVKWAALALALTALSHILTTIVVIFASLFVLGSKKGLLRTLLIWVWGFAIAAFWALPLLARIGLTSDMAWTPLSRLEEIFPVEVWLLLPLAIVGAVWAVRRSTRAIPLIAATLLPVIYFPLPNLLPELAPGLFDGQRWKLWNGRLLPYWYFGVAFFAAVAVGAAVVWASRRIPSRISMGWVRGLIVLVAAVGAGLAADSTEFPDYAWVFFVAGGFLVLIASLWWGSDLGGREFLVSFAVAVVALGALSGVTFVDGWARWNYQGYEAKEAWPEFETLMAEIEALPDGRVQWEGNGDWNDYGTPMAPMLIPYWTEDTHASMEGLYFESSLTTPFHFINSSEMSAEASNPIPGLKYHNLQMDRGLKHLDLYGVSYYVSFTDEAREVAESMDGMTLISTVDRYRTVDPNQEKQLDGQFGIFAIEHSGLVEAAALVPSVYEVPERGPLAALIGSETVLDSDGNPLPSFHDMALEWYEDVENLDQWVVSDGPDSWRRIESLDEREAVPTGAPENAVSDIVVDDHLISFHTEAVGVPHLVKVSYFPNWEATGAEGPYRATPSVMMVIPTEENVVIEFNDTWAEQGGKLLSGLGLLGLVAVGVAIWFRRRSESQQDRSGEAV